MVFLANKARALIIIKTGRWNEKEYLEVSKERVHEQVEHNERRENSIQYSHEYKPSA